MYFKTSFANLRFINQWKGCALIALVVGLVMLFFACSEQINTMGKTRSMAQVQKPARKTDVEEAQQWFAESEMTHRPDLFQFFPDRKGPPSDVAIPEQELGVPPPGLPQPPSDDNRFPLPPPEMNLPPPDQMPFDPRTFDQDAFETWLKDQESVNFNEPEEEYPRDMQWSPQNSKQDTNDDLDNEGEFENFPPIPPNQVHRMNQYENRLPPWMRHTQGNYYSQLEEFSEPQNLYPNYFKDLSIDRDYNKGNFNDKDNGGKFEDEKNGLENKKYLESSNFDQLDLRESKKNENDFTQRKLMNYEAQHFETDVPRKRFPTVLLIGSENAGAGEFLTFLSTHPSVVPAVEINYFSNKDNRYYFDSEWYLSRMPLSTANQITIEGSPKYFVDPQVPERVQQFNNSILLIVILRDPVKRIILDYTQKALKHSGKYPSFDELVFDGNGNVNVSYEPVQVGIYYKHIIRWLQHFPRENLMVIDGELFVSDPAAVLQKAEKFLGIQPVITTSDFFYDDNKGFFCTKTHECIGTTNERNHPKISTEAQRKLEDFYIPYNKKLFNLLNTTSLWANMIININF